MKTYSPFFSTLSMLCMLAAFQTVNAQVKYQAQPDIEEEEEYEAREKSMLLAWKYPEGSMPDRASAAKAIALLRNSSAKSAALSWTRRGPAYGKDTIQSFGPDSTIGRANCVRIDPVNPGIVWAGSASGGLWKSADGGKNWTVNAALEQFQSIGVTDIAINPKNTQEMYIATGDGDYTSAYSIGILKSSDGGNSWATLNTASWSLSPSLIITRILIHPTHPDTVIFACSNAIYRTADGGKSWFTPTIANGGSFKDLEFHPGNPDIIYASSKQFVFKSIDGGVSWNMLGGGLPTGGGFGRISLAVTKAAPNMIYALYSHAPYNSTDIYGLFRSTDSGTNWTMVANATALPLGLMSRYTTALAVSPGNSNEVWAAGTYASRSLDGGITWTSMAAGYYDYHEIEYSPFNSNVIFSVCDGGIYRCTNGSTFRFSSFGMEITQFYKIGLSTQSSIMFSGAQDMGHFLYHSPGKWDHSFFGDGMESMIDYSDENYMYKSIQMGNCYRSSNKGISFTNIKPFAAGSGDWVTPFMMHPSDPKIIYAGYAALWKTANRGASWTQVSPDLSSPSSRINSLAISDSNPLLMVAAAIDSIYRTADGGTTWTCVNGNLPTAAAAISALAIHPLTPNTMWVTFAGFSSGNKVFKSSDGGATWTNVSGTLPNLPVNCIVYEKNSADALYIGTDIGVFHRDNNMSDWQYVSTGLPNVIVRELEINYQKGELVAATHGRGVWAAAMSSMSGLSAKEAMEEELLIYPNPASQMVSIELTRYEFSLELLDMTGKVLYKEEKGQGRTSLDVAGFAPGLYVLRVTSGTQALYRKLVIGAK